jgi:formylglycine-generating enzyme required for sulfatase activity
MILVEGGTFTMGNNNGEPDEQPAHSVTLSSFKIGKYEVTMAQYKAFCQATDRQMGEAPPWGWNDKYPMVYITFDDANAYCNWLSSKEGVKYRLPTEAEWEYAGIKARAILTAEVMILMSPVGIMITAAKNRMPQALKHQMNWAYMI